MSETKYKKTRRMKTKTFVFATSNNAEKIIEPLQSRFFIVKLQAYTYEQFCEITLELLTSKQYNVDVETARAITDAVWNSSKSIRDTIRVARIAESVEDVEWLESTFFKKDWKGRRLGYQGTMR